MRRSRSTESLPLDLEIERTIRRLRREKQIAEARMAAEARKELRQYSVPSWAEATSCIRPPLIEANNFELKHRLIQMIQSSYSFGGLPSEDPNEHILRFVEVCNTQKYNGVPKEALRLMLFPFSLNGKARAWLNSLPRDSVTTWEDLMTKFLNKFFPPSKASKLRESITSFAQLDNETIYEA